MTVEDLATGGDQPETTTTQTTEKVEATAEGDQTPKAPAAEGSKPDAAKDAKEAEAASEAAKALQRRRQTMQERLNEQSFQRRKAELRAEQAERELADLRGKKAPNPDEYTDPAKLAADQLNYTLDQRDARRLESVKTEANKEADEAVAFAWQERKQVFIEENPDTDIDKLLAVTRLSTPTSMMIADMEDGPRVFVQLAKNPVELRRIEGLPERQRPFELGRLAERLSAPPPKRITNAPTPVIAASGKSGGGSGLDDDLPPEEWRRRREAQIRAARR